MHSLHSDMHNLGFYLTAVNYTTSEVEIYKAHTHKTILQRFSGITRVSRCQKKAPSGLHGAREDKRQTHHSFGWVPLHQD